MLRYINSSIRPLRYFSAPSQAAADKYCVFDRTIEISSLNKLYHRQQQVWKPSAAEFCIHYTNNYPRQFHYSVTDCHQFSAVESGLKVSYVMEFEDVKAGLGDKSLVLIDVRNPDEIQQHGKIPGSINIPRKYIGIWHAYIDWLFGVHIIIACPFGSSTFSAIMNSYLHIVECSQFVYPC